MEHWAKMDKHSYQSLCTVTNLRVIELAKAIDITHFFSKKDNSYLIQFFHDKAFSSHLILIFKFFVK